MPRTSPVFLVMAIQDSANDPRSLQGQEHQILDRSLQCHWRSFAHKGTGKVTTIGEITHLLPTSFKEFQSRFPHEHGEKDQQTQPQPQAWSTQSWQERVAFILIILACGGFANSRVTCSSAKWIIIYCRFRPVLHNFQAFPRLNELKITICNEKKPGMSRWEQVAKFRQKFLQFTIST